MATQTKKITLDTAAIFSGKFVGLLVGVLRLNYLATYLGVAGFGILNFATYFCSLFQVLFDLGISPLLTRELARDLSRSREFVGKLILLKLIVVFLASLVVGLVGIVSHFDRVTSWAILLTTAVFAVNGISMVFLSAFQAHRKMTLISLANIGNDVLLSVAIILTIQQSPYVTTALVLGVLVSIANVAVLFITYCRQVGMPEFHMDTTLWKALLKESTPIAVSALGISMYTFIGSTVLKYTRGDVEVGIYSAGFKLISILTLIPTAFTQVVYPIFSDFYSTAKEKLGKALRDSLRVMFQISAPLAVGTVILAPRIISIIYPASYAEASIVLQVIIAGNAFGYLAWILYSFLLAVNQQKYCMWNSILVASSVFVASLVFIPRFGYRAVAGISLITDLTVFSSLALYTIRLGYALDEGTKFMRIILSCAVMGLGLFALRNFYFIPLVIIASLLYFGLLLTLRTFGDQERELLGKVLNR